MLESRHIDYALLARAKDFYVDRGFTYIEVPWAVSPESSLTTAPNEDCVYITTRNEHLVGSAEQSFIELTHQGSLQPEIDYCAISPCFRRDEPDDTHSRWFMKLELFSFSNRRLPQSVKLYRYIEMAEMMFREIAGVQTYRKHEKGILDLYHKDLELGSYGVRMIHSNIICTFGTGIALPRASVAQGE